MSTRCTLATARRVLTQLVHDRRTIALMLLVPVFLMGLLRWVFTDDPQVFNSIGLPLLGIFPFVTMFLVTSVATLRERTSGTLERLLAMPIGKGDFVVGYQLAFGVFAIIQSLIAAAAAIWLMGLAVAGPIWAAVLVAVLVALLGTAFGLGVSAFAKTEFQAVQFMPLVVLPQFLLCGLLAPRDTMAPALTAISNVLPLSYAVDAMNAITTQTTLSQETWIDLAVVFGFGLAALAVGALTLRRQSD